MAKEDPQVSMHEGRKSQTEARLARRISISKLHRLNFVPIKQKEEKRKKQKKQKNDSKVLNFLKFFLKWAFLSGSYISDYDTVTIFELLDGSAEEKKGKNKNISLK